MAHGSCANNIFAIPGVIRMSFRFGEGILWKYVVDLSIKFHVILTPRSSLLSCLVKEKKKGSLSLWP